MLNHEVKHFETILKYFKFFSPYSITVFYNKISYRRIKLLIKHFPLEI